MHHLGAFLARYYCPVKHRFPVLLAALVLTIYTGAISMIAGHCARVKTETATTALYEEKLAALQAELNKAAANEPSEGEAENAAWVAMAEKLARVLYGFKDNNESDLITACWCVFNRVDIKTGEYAYLSTLEEVIDQPGQWMGYSEENPVLENLYRISYSQIESWLNGGHRPVSSEYVFLVWSPGEIYLKTALEDGKGTKTWHYNG